MNAILKVGDTDFQPVRLSREAIVRLVDSGALEGLGRVEIIDRVMIETSPSWLPHARALSRIHLALGSRLAAAYEVTLDQLVLFGQDGLHAPDIAVFDGGVAKSEPDSGDLRFVVEVAEASLEYELGLKAQRYAAHGVPELWGVDLVNRCLVVHRQPKAQGYAELRSLGWNEAAAPLILPGARIVLAELLDT